MGVGCEQQQCGRSTADSICTILYRIAVRAQAGLAPGTHTRAELLLPLSAISSQSSSYRSWCHRLPSPIWSIVAGHVDVSALAVSAVARWLDATQSLHKLY